MRDFLLSVAATLAAGLLVFAADVIRKAAFTVAESARAVSDLADVVSTLSTHDAENRERIAALWAHVFNEWSQHGN